MFDSTFQLADIFSPFRFQNPLLQEALPNIPQAEGRAPSEFPQTPELPNPSRAQPGSSLMEVTSVSALDCPPWKGRPRAVSVTVISPAPFSTGLGTVETFVNTCE